MSALLTVFFAEKDPREANNRDDWIKLGEGRSIDYLEWENIDSGRLWKLTTTWIDAPRLAPVIDAICGVFPSVVGDPPVDDAW